MHHLHELAAACLSIAAVLPAQSNGRYSESMGSSFTAYQDLGATASQWQATRAHLISNVQLLGAKEEAYEISVDGPFGINRVATYRLEIGNRVVRSGRIAVDGRYVVPTVTGNVYPQDVVATLGFRSGLLTLRGNVIASVSMDETFSFTPATETTAYADIKGSVRASAVGKMDLVRSTSYVALQAVLGFGRQHIDGHIAYVPVGYPGLEYQRGNVYLLLKAATIVFPNLRYELLLFDTRRQVTINPFLSR